MSTGLQFQTYFWLSSIFVFYGGELRVRWEDGQCLMRKWTYWDGRLFKKNNYNKPSQCTMMRTECKYRQAQTVWWNASSYVGVVYTGVGIGSNLPSFKILARLCVFTGIPRGCVTILLRRIFRNIASRNQIISQKRGISHAHCAISKIG